MGSALHWMKSQTRRLALGALTAALGFLAGSLAAAQSPDNPATWPRGTLPVRLAAPDLSFLNHKPAGSRGRVSANGVDLVYEDGTPARFWGTNLQAYALFQTKPEHIRAHARRIAALGFNLVRIHQHDSKWVNPNIFGKKNPQTTQIYAPALRQLDLWISALKAEGVYIWLDMHSGRQMKTRDGIAHFEELREGSGLGNIQGFSYVSPTIQQRMLEFQDAYLGHVNPLTGLAYAEDPAIVAVLITNENDLTRHFGNLLVPDKGAPRHSATYMALAEQFAEAYGLDPHQTWRSWKHGPSKIFLNDLEQRFNTRMISGIRDTGFAGLIATTNFWGRMPVWGLPSLTTGSIIDVHSYGGTSEIDANPHETPGFLDWIAAGQVAGRPLSISEWNVSPFPVEDRFISPLSMATAAAHQGWDAPMVYGYAQQPLNKILKPSNWDIASDPGMIAMMPAAALLYRQGHVRLAEKTYALRLGAEDLFGIKVTPKTSMAIRTLSGQSRFVIEMPSVPALPWLEPATAPDEAIAVTDPGQSYLPADAKEVTADTGEFRRDFSRGLFTVDTPRSQIAAGRFGQETVMLSNVEITSANPLAAVAVQSLDGAPIGSSRRILISLSARATPSGKKQLTYQIEPLRGHLRIEADPKLQLQRPGREGAPFKRAHRLEGDVHVIDLERTGGARWLVLE